MESFGNLVADIQSDSSISFCSLFSSTVYEGDQFESYEYDTSYPDFLTTTSTFKTKDYTNCLSLDENIKLLFNDSEHASKKLLLLSTENGNSMSLDKYNFDKILTLSKRKNSIFLICIVSHKLKVLHINYKNN